MKDLFIYMILLLHTLVACGQNSPEKIHFNANGEYKIAQFTDMHLGNNPEQNREVFDMIREILDSEKPDMVVFSGDNTVTDNVQQLWETLSAELASRKIPWTATLGNHDDEHAVKRKEIIEIIRKQPYCIMRNVEKDIYGEGNHIIPVYGSTNKNKIEALLYCMDSNAYSTIDTVKGYGWFDFSQIEWYKRESDKYTRQNRGQPLPALAFFHIPLPEYAEAWNSFRTKRYGDRNEKECYPNVNSGMFLAMLECRDVMGTFVGHDHVNDYIATLHTIALGYGRASGGKNSYGDKKPGSRLIVLKEGERAFDTWIREKGNTQSLYKCHYPHSFLLKK